MRRIAAVILITHLIATATAQDPQGGSDELARETAAAQRALVSASASPAAVRQDGRPELRIILTESPPKIDGRLDDPAWAHAAVIDDLVQLDPVEGAPPTERTEARLLYDRDHLYVGVHCFDSEPDAIVATQMVRNAELQGDDRVAIVIDTFFDRRNGFFFELNPVGAKGDALIENSGRPNRDWDGIWYGKAEIVEDGWIAEFAIPFKTVSFDPATDRWGFNIERNIVRKRERDRWSGARQDFRLSNMSEAGIIAGIRDIEQGLGLDVIPSLSLKLRHDRVNDRDVFTYDPGLDVFYKLTPQLTGALTINTDFAETEVDERRVNLTRFPLFFPEKRDFFLQDAGIFSFGGIRRDPIPFFSRRIGIGPDGSPVDILAGLKVTGRVGPVNLGFLDVQLGDADGVDGKNVAVGRVAVNVLEESTIGVIGTWGDPRSELDNALAGADFNFRTSRFLGNKVLTGNLWFQHTETEGVGAGQDAWGMRIAYPNDEIDASLGYSEVHSNFNPALGFTRRLGIREYFTRFRYRIRPGGYFRTIDSSLFGIVITDLSDDVDTARATLTPLELRNQQGDELELQYELGYERLVEGFEISDGIVIPVGHYRTDRFSVRAQTAEQRVVSGQVEVSWGDFFSGTRLQVTASVRWTPSRYFLFAAEYDQNDVDLREGSFTTRVARARLNVYFDPDISWVTFIQYDNVSKEVGANSRFRWIVEPGREIFVVFNQGVRVESGGITPTFTEFAFKVGWTFRF